MKGNNCSGPTLGDTEDRVRLGNACLAGLIGITADTAMLQIAPLLHLHPGSGGVLQLLLVFAGRSVPSILATMHTIGLENPPPLFGYLWFHFATGLVMIFFYLYVFARHMRGTWMWKATLFAVLVWLVNSGIVYPMLGEGFAGTHEVPASGVLYFFIANWVFVTVSALVYRRLVSERLS